MSMDGIIIQPDGITPSILHMNELINNLLKLQSLEFEEKAGPEIEKQIATLRAKIPAPILGHYDRLVARGKKGTAAVRHEVCTACHMRVPRGVVLTLLHGEDIQLCENCGRYLYLAEKPEFSKLDISQRKPKTARGGSALQPVA